MASCQQVEKPICGNCKCRKPQALTLPQGQNVSATCKAYPGRALANVCTNPGLVPLDWRVTLVDGNNNDPTQIWVKVEIKNNDNDKQKVQFLPVPVPVYAFVNTSTGLTLRANGDEVGLTEKFDKDDKNEQWTESEDKGDGFENIISADGNVWTAEEGKEGIKIMLRTANNQENQLWKILP